MATDIKAKSDELMKSEDREKSLHNVVLFKLSLRSLSNFTLLLPLSGLFICFVTGYIFQAEEIHETHCRVSIHIKIILYMNIPLVSFLFFFVLTIFMLQNNEHCNDFAYRNKKKNNLVL